MKLKLDIVFGKEQVLKTYKNEPLTIEEKCINLKSFEFKTDAEKIAFTKGLEEAVGWTDFLVLEELVNS